MCFSICICTCICRIVYTFIPMYDSWIRELIHGILNQLVNYKPYAGTMLTRGTPMGQDEHPVKASCFGVVERWIVDSRAAGPMFIFIYLICSMVSVHLELNFIEWSWYFMGVAPRIHHKSAPHFFCRRPGSRRFFVAWRLRWSSSFADRPRLMAKPDLDGMWICNSHLIGI